MTLKEKFIEAFKSGKRFDIKNAEVIVDEFTIYFIKWVCETEYNLEYFYKRNKIKELLKIYKKHYENI